MSIGVSKQHDVAKLHLLIRKSDCLVPYVLCLPLYLRKSDRRSSLSLSLTFVSNVKFRGNGTNGIDGSALTRSARSR
jgi:hypothetical protein